MEKIIIYQVLPRLFGNRTTSHVANGTIAENGCGKMNDLSDAALRKITALGTTHVWFTGIIRHATQTDYTGFGIPRNHPAIVKGKAGSPYAITDYYDVDPDLATNVANRMEEFEHLVERTHQAGMKVIIDFVPNHVARQYHSLCKPRNVKDLGVGDDTSKGFDPQNNFYYCPGQRFAPYIDLLNGERNPYIEEPAKATGNDHFDPAPGQNDWYETVKLNYGVDYYAGRVGHFDPIPNTWKKMVDILLFWAKKGIDAFRCDMAEMVPAEFWAFATAAVRKKYKHVQFIGEVYNPQEYRRYIASGFDFLYDKVGMYDTLRTVTCHQIGTEAITHAWQQTDDIRSHMLYFLENHDEQRIASDFFVGSPLKGIPALATAALMQQNPFMLYFGEEYGERGMDSEGFSGRDGRTTIFDYWAVDSICRAAKRKLTTEEKQVYALHTKILNIARSERCISEGCFFDLMYANTHLHQQYVFLRKVDDEMLVVAANFADEAVNIQVAIPSHAFDFLGVNEQDVKATDLLSKKKWSIALRRDGAVPMQMESRGVNVWKINLKR